MKYTKGPWIVRQNWPFTQYDLQISKMNGTESIPNKEAEANRTLIQAAPEMYEALLWAKDAFMHLAELGKYPEFLLSENGGSGIETITNALAKAEGKQ